MQIDEAKVSESVWPLRAAVRAWLAGGALLGANLRSSGGEKESHSVSHSCSGWFNIPRKWQRHQVVEEDACLGEQRSVCDTPSPPALFISGKHDFYGSLGAKCKTNYSSLASQLLAASPVSRPWLWAPLFLSTALAKEWAKRSQAKRD